MIKNLQIEKQKNNKVFIQFPTLTYLNDSVINKILNIIDVFNFSTAFVKVKGKSENIKELKDINKIKEITILNSNEINFIIKKKDLNELLNKFNPDKYSIELFVYNDVENYKEINLDDEYNFYLYLIDNNGPVLMFNQEIYPYSNIINQIKKILN